MKQSDKSKITYDKILKAAIAEFGTKGYDNSSLNIICNDNNISKGLIYHNFKNKDALYLSCVEMCFKEITAFLSNEKYQSVDFKVNIKNLMDLRHKFFIDHPYYSMIFFNAVLLPPSHLADEIREIKKDFDSFNLEQYRKIINSVTLREGISEAEALEYFFIFGEMFNSYFGSKAYKTSDFNSLVNDHEMQISKILNLILYGIVKEV